MILVKPKDLKKIYKKFSNLDRSKKGFVTIDDISKIPEIEKNPLRFYICQYLSYKSKNEDEINFEAFVKLVDIFKNNKTQEQYKCKICIYI
jgi:Ca2+-binding EF-hand superfamily protein